MWPTPRHDPSPDATGAFPALPGLLALAVAWSVAVWEAVWLGSASEYRVPLVVLPAAAYLTAVAVAAQRSEVAGRLVRSACAHVVAWGVAGLLLSIAFVVTVDVGDFPLPFFLLGLVCGALSGAAFAVLRAHTDPSRVGVQHDAVLGFGAGLFVWALAAGTWAVLHGMGPELPLLPALALAPPLTGGATVLGALRGALFPHR